MLLFAAVALDAAAHVLPGAPSWPSLQGVLLRLPLLAANVAAALAILAGSGRGACAVSAGAATGGLAADWLAADLGEERYEAAALRLLLGVLAALAAVAGDVPRDARGADRAAGGGGCMSTVTSGGGDAARQGFYESALAAADASALREARALSGLDDEVALLRVQLRRAFADAEADPRTVQAGRAAAGAGAARAAPALAAAGGAPGRGRGERAGGIRRGAGEWRERRHDEGCFARSLPRGHRRAGCAALAHPPALGISFCGGLRPPRPRWCTSKGCCALGRPCPPGVGVAGCARSPSPPPSPARGEGAGLASGRRSGGLRPLPLTPSLSRKGRGGRRVRPGAPGGGVGAQPPHEENPRVGGWARAARSACSSGMGVWGAQPPTRGDGFRLPPE